MSYQNTIARLQADIIALNKRLVESTDETTKKSLQEKKVACETEIRRLLRAQWEDTHERVRLDDDR